MPKQAVLCLSAWGRYAFGSSSAFCFLLNIRVIWEIENCLPVWRVSNVHRIPGIVLLFSTSLFVCVCKLRPGLGRVRLLWKGRCHGGEMRSWDAAPPRSSLCLERRLCWGCPQAPLPTAATARDLEKLQSWDLAKPSQARPASSPPRQLLSPRSVPSVVAQRCSVLSRLGEAAIWPDARGVLLQKHPPTSPLPSREAERPVARWRWAWLSHGGLLHLRR